MSSLSPVPPALPADSPTPLFLINYNEKPASIDMEFTPEGRPIVYNRMLKSELIGGFRIDIVKAKDYWGREVMRLPSDQADPKLIALYKRAFINIFYNNDLRFHNFALVQAHEIPPGMKNTNSTIGL